MWLTYTQFSKHYSRLVTVDKLVQAMHIRKKITGRLRTSSSSSESILQLPSPDQEQTRSHTSRWLTYTESKYALRTLIMYDMVMQVTVHH